VTDSVVGHCVNYVDHVSVFLLRYRLRRDISERGRDLEGVLKQYNTFVKPVGDQQT